MIVFQSVLLTIVMFMFLSRMLPYWHHGSTSLSDTSPEQGVFNAAADHANIDFSVAESFQVVTNIDFSVAKLFQVIINIEFSLVESLQVIVSVIVNCVLTIYFVIY